MTKHIDKIKMWKQSHKKSIQVYFLMPFTPANNTNEWYSGFIFNFTIKLIPKKNLATRQKYIPHLFLDNPHFLSLLTEFINSVNIYWILGLCTVWNDKVAMVWEASRLPGPLPNLGLISGTKLGKKKLLDIAVEWKPGIWKPLVSPIFSLTTWFGLN